jgi:predicted ATPase
MVETVIRFVGDRHMLIVLDNCEHLLDATAALIVDLLGTCPGLKLLATSREPIGVTGEVIWRVPSLSLADEAIEPFTDRGRHVRSKDRVGAAAGYSSGASPAGRVLSSGTRVRSVRLLELHVLELAGILHAGTPR